MSDSLEPTERPGRCGSDRLNRMFDAAFSGEPRGRRWVPAVDIYQTRTKDIVVKVELPECSGRIAGRSRTTCSPSGRAQVPADIDREQSHRSERGYGAFVELTLPATVDARASRPRSVTALTARCAPRGDPSASDPVNG